MQQLENFDFKDKEQILGLINRADDHAEYSLVANNEVKK
jgi:hypothetical protein